MSTNPHNRSQHPQADENVDATEIRRRLWFSLGMMSHSAKAMIFSLAEFEGNEEMTICDWITAHRERLQRGTAEDRENFEDIATWSILNHRNPDPRDASTWYKWWKRAKKSPIPKTVLVRLKQRFKTVGFRESQKTRQMKIVKVRKGEKIGSRGAMRIEKRKVKPAPAEDSPKHIAKQKPVAKFPKFPEGQHYSASQQGKAEQNTGVVLPKIKQQTTAFNRAPVPKAPIQPPTHNYPQYQKENIPAKPTCAIANKQKTMSFESYLERKRKRALQTDVQASTTDRHLKHVAYQRVNIPLTTNMSIGAKVPNVNTPEVLLKLRQ